MEERKVLCGMEDISQVMVAKERKKVELFHLCIAALKQIKLAASGKDHKTLLDAKTHAFFNISKFLSSVCMQPCFRCSLVII